MPRSFDNIDPNLLAELDEDASFVERHQQRRFMPRVKIEREESMLLRFLPVEIGINKHWLGRVAQHWVNGKPVFCRRKTSRYLGGDEHYDCPNCKFLDQWSKHTDKGIADRAFQCQSGYRWFGAVLIWAFRNKTTRGRPQEVPPPQCYVPHEMTLLAPAFKSVRDLATQYAITGTKGLVDLVKGVDIWFHRQKNGQFMLQVSGQSAVNESSGEPIQEVVNEIWKNVIIPEIKMPTQAEEQEFLLKVMEFVRTGVEGSRGQEAPPDDFEDTPPGNLPPPTRGRSRLGGNGFAPPQTASEPEELEAAPPATPRIPTAPAAPPPTSVSTPPPAVPPTIQAAPVPKLPTNAAPVVPASSVTPKPSKLIPPRTAPSVSPPPSPAAAGVRDSVPLPGATEEDENDGVAPEIEDPAPPVREEQVNLENVPSTVIIPPPSPLPPAPVTPQLKTPGGNLNENLRNRLKSFQTPK